MIGRSRPSERDTRIWRSSVSRSSPAPDLLSQVVTPFAMSRLMRRRARRVERFLGERAGAARHRQDPGPRGFEIPPSPALGQHLEVVQPLLPVDDMGVRVHESGSDDPAAEVAHLGRVFLVRRGARPDPRDLPVRDPDGSIRDEPERLRAVHRRHIGVCQQKVMHAYRSSLQSRRRSSPRLIVRASEARRP